MADPVIDVLAPWAANFSKLATVFGSTLTTWQTTYIDPLYKVTGTEYTDIVLPEVPKYKSIVKGWEYDVRAARDATTISEENTKLKKDYYTLLATSLAQSRSTLTGVLTAIALDPTKSANATSALDKIISDFNTSVTKLKALKYNAKNYKS